jgi:osmotically-inducible protein OsmY
METLMNLKETNDAINQQSHIGIQKFADERIQQECQETLFRCQQLDATDIHVTVVNGIVELSGHAENQFAMKKAETSLQNIKGIIDIHNNLELRQVAKEHLS